MFALNTKDSEGDIDEKPGTRFKQPTQGGTRPGAVFHAVADLALVPIQADVIHRFRGGAWCSESARPLSSAFLHQVLLPRPIHSNLPGIFLMPSRVVLRTSG